MAMLAMELPTLITVRALHSQRLAATVFLCVLMVTPHLEYRTDLRWSVTIRETSMPLQMTAT
jgi:hypothetical protein